MANDLTVTRAALHIVCKEARRLEAKAKSRAATIRRLLGEIRRLNHILGVFKFSVGCTYKTVRNAEDDVRINPDNGRLEAWCLGEWCDVEKAQREFEEPEEDADQ